MPSRCIADDTQVCVTLSLDVKVSWLVYQEQSWIGAQGILIPSPSTHVCECFKMLVIISSAFFPLHVMSFQNYFVLPVLEQISLCSVQKEEKDVVRMSLDCYCSHCVLNFQTFTEDIFIEIHISTVSPRAAFASQQHSSINVIGGSSDRPPIIVAHARSYCHSLYTFRFGRTFANSQAPLADPQPPALGKSFCASSKLNEEQNFLPFEILLYIVLYPLGQKLWSKRFLLAWDFYFWQSQS